MFESIKNFFRKKNRNAQAYQTMKLDDFVKETLVQIVSGVSKAQAECQSKKYGAIISPKEIHGEGEDSYIMIGGLRDAHAPQTRSIQYVDMDLAVTVTESATTHNGIDFGQSVSANISVFGANINTEGKYGKEKQKSNVQVSRVHFRVPICLPLQKPSEVSSK